MYTLDIGGLGMKKSKIDKLGRIVIPKEMREMLGLRANTDVVIEIVGDYVKVKRAGNICALCGAEIIHSDGLALCDRCITEVKNS